MCLNDDRLYEKIRTLFLTNRLSQGVPAFGVAMQVVRCGLGSLSWKQRFIYLGQVVPLLRTMDDLTLSLPSSEVCRGRNSPRQSQGRESQCSATLSS